MESFRYCSGLLSQAGVIPFQEYIPKGISHPVVYSDLVYKLRRVRGTNNFIFSGTKLLKRIWRRQYDQGIIEKTIGLGLGLTIAICSIPLSISLWNNKAVGTTGWILSKRPQRRQCPEICPIWLLVGTSTALEPYLAYRLGGVQPALADVTWYFWFNNYYHQHFVRNLYVLSAWGGCLSFISIWRFIYKILIFLSYWLRNHCRKLACWNLKH